MNKKSAELNQFLIQGFYPFEEKLYNRELSELTIVLQQQSFKIPVKKDETQGLYNLVDFFKKGILEARDELKSMHHDLSEFNQFIKNSSHQSEKNIHIIDFARKLGADEKHLKKDEAAFSRWFGYDAVISRYEYKQNLLQRKLSFLLGRIGQFAGKYLKSRQERSDWEKLDLDGFIYPFLDFEGDERVCMAAMRSLRKCLKCLPEKYAEQWISVNVIQHVYRVSMDRRKNVWLQSTALELLLFLSCESFIKVLENRFGSPGSGDNLFLRARAVTLAGSRIHLLNDGPGLLDKMFQDSSPHVRKEFTGILKELLPEKAIEYCRAFILEDPEPAVRASAALKVFPLLIQYNEYSGFLDILVDALKLEKDEFVLRVFLKIAVDVMGFLDEDAKIKWFKRIMPELNIMHFLSDNLKVRRWSIMTQEKLWCCQDRDASRLYSILSKKLEEIRYGDYLDIRKKSLQTEDPETLGRVCSILAQNDAGLDIENRLFSIRFIRGDRFKRRFWRILFEFFNPKPDKRQAFLHTTGRYFSGSRYASSSIMAELSQTKVPGEPLFQASENGWRPYIPIPDHILSILLSGRETKIYTPEGITTVRPVLLPLRWWKAFALSLTFRSVAEMRNWSEDMQANPADYVNHLRKLGLKIDFKNHTYPGCDILPDQSVHRFFKYGSEA